MPLKLNVGLARKVGEANYGSRGASINVEMEVDSSLIGDPGKLQERIRGLFSFVRHAVDEELTSPTGSPLPAPPTADLPRLPAPNTQTSPNGGGGHRNGPRAATLSQVKAIHSICRAQKLDALAFVRQHFNVNRVDDLSLQQASQAIDHLKAQQKGR